MSEAGSSSTAAVCSSNPQKEINKNEICNLECSVPFFLSGHQKIRRSFLYGRAVRVRCFYSCNHPSSASNPINPHSPFLPPPRLPHPPTPSQISSLFLHRHQPPQPVLCDRSTALVLTTEFDPHRLRLALLFVIKTRPSTRPSAQVSHPKWRNANNNRKLTAPSNGYKKVSLHSMASTTSCRHRSSLPPLRHHRRRSSSRT